MTVLKDPGFLQPFCLANYAKISVKEMKKNNVEWSYNNKVGQCWLKTEVQLAVVLILHKHEVFEQCHDWLLGSISLVIPGHAAVNAMLAML